MWCRQAALALNGTGGHPGSARGRPSYLTQLPAQPADPCNKVALRDCPAAGLTLLLAEGRDWLRHAATEDGGSAAAALAWWDAVEHHALAELGRMQRTGGTP